MEVLIAEDDLTTQTMLRSVFRKWGYVPVTTGDGREALEMLQRTCAPKLVILDWNMPGMDGPEVCRHIREKETSNPAYIIILTARGEKQDIVQGLESGANDYVTKPYDIMELHARIRVGQRMVELQKRLHETQDALARQALRDSLTGMLNRRAILETLDQVISWAGRTGRTFSVGLCDIDHFKEINDYCGHQVGDEVLCVIAGCIQAALRKYDHAGRYGGDEFLVVGPNSLKPYERICVNVAKEKAPVKAGNRALSVSIGVAEGKGHHGADTLIAAADVALYQAKKDGRNKVVYTQDKVCG